MYAALMGWRLREDDGRCKPSLMDARRLGQLRTLSGAAPADSFAASGNGQPPRSAVRAFAWVIDTWDAKSVAAALEKRGLTPLADNKRRGSRVFA